MKRPSNGVINVRISNDSAKEIKVENVWRESADYLNFYEILLILHARKVTVKSKQELWII